MSDLQRAIYDLEGKLTWAKECENHFVDELIDFDVIDTAIAALRDVQARQRGCKYCAINDWERKPLATFNTYFNNYEEEQHEIGIDDYEGGYRIASTLGNNGPSVDIRFCPNCGRNLTEKEGGE